jgi:hypothetical protein
VAVETLTWWAVLSTVAVVNLVFWALSVRVLQPRLAVAEGFDRDFCRLQLILSFGYVLGCAWRSVLPVYDVPRQVLVDSWFSSVIVGRSVATVAELCFAAQWALLLRAVAQAGDSRAVRFVARLIVPLIVAAEVCSWHAVLTTDNLGHVIEESLWGLCAALVVAGLLRTAPRLQGRLRLFAVACGIAGLGYAAYMFGVDVPMYWTRWLADQAQGRVYLDLMQGFADASSRWVVTHDWAHWRSEVIWMTAYFSVAVWVSIGLAHAPRLVPLRRHGP